MRVVLWSAYTAKKKLAQLPAVDMQKVQGSLWCYSNLFPRVIQPSLDAQWRCQKMVDEKIMQNSAKVLTCNTGLGDDQLYPAKGCSSKNLVYSHPHCGSARNLFITSGTAVCAVPAIPACLPPYHQTQNSVHFDQVCPPGIIGQCTQPQRLFVL